MAGKIQNEDIKSVSELTSPSSLPNDDKVYVTANSINKTLKQAIIDGDLSGANDPIITRFTTGSGTHNITSGCKYLKIKAIGGGGGGSGGGSSVTGGGNGGDSTINTTDIIAKGGIGASGNAGAQGAANTISIGTTVVNVAGAAGGTAILEQASIAIVSTGGTGGAIFGGNSPGAVQSSNANNATNGTGGGAGGGVANGSFAGNSAGGGGGSSGSYVEVLITTPASSYTYSVGAGGSKGTSLANGTDGGVGGNGFIIFEEYF